MPVPLYPAALSESGHKAARELAMRILETTAPSNRAATDSTVRLLENLLDVFRDWVLRSALRGLLGDLDR